MSFLTTTTTLTHRTPLPPTTTLTAAISMLQDHPFFFECNPHTASSTQLPVPSPPPTIPPTITPVNSTNPTVSYSATDIVHTLPAGLWDSKVVSTYEFTDIERGVFVRIKSPMGVSMDTVWSIEDEGEGLVLVENIAFTCSRFLAGIVRGTCESGWGKIHEKMVGRLRG